MEKQKQSVCVSFSFFLEGSLRPHKSGVGQRSKNVDVFLKARPLTSTMNFYFDKTTITSSSKETSLSSTTQVNGNRAVFNMQAEDEAETVHGVKRKR